MRRFLSKYFNIEHSTVSPVFVTDNLFPTWILSLQKIGLPPALLSCYLYFPTKVFISLEYINQKFIEMQFFNREAWSQLLKQCNLGIRCLILLFHLWSQFLNFTSKLDRATTGSPPACGQPLSTSLWYKCTPQRQTTMTTKEKNYMTSYRMALIRHRKNEHSSCARRLERKSGKGCWWKLGRHLWTLLQGLNKWERTQASEACRYQRSCVGEHCWLPQRIQKIDLALPKWTTIQPD